MESLKNMLKLHLEVTGERRVFMLYTNKRKRAVNNLIASSTKVLRGAGIAGKAASIVEGMGIVFKYWTLGHLCRAINKMDLRVVAVTSDGQEFLDLLECSSFGHDGPPPSIVDYGQQLGR